MSDSSQHGDDPRDGAGSSADDVFATPGAGAEADAGAVVSDDQFKEGQMDDLRVAVLALDADYPGLGTLMAQELPGLPDDDLLATRTRSELGSAALR